MIVLTAAVRLVTPNMGTGNITCKCGWTRPLQDGFPWYCVEQCPKCTPGLVTESRKHFITEDPHNEGGLLVHIGNWPRTFLLQNGQRVPYTGNYQVVFPVKTLGQAYKLINSRQ